MNRLTRVAGYTVLAIGVAATAGISATIGWRPFVGPRARALTDRRFQVTAQRLERGRYLTSSGGVGCMMCHSELKLEPGGLMSLAPGTEFAGRNWAPDGIPFVTAPNLTPDPETGIGNWSDDTLARAIREGISHDGRALFPIMPYEKMRAMSDEDLASVIVYFRSLTPVKRTLQKTDIPFPVKSLINAVPDPVTEPVSADVSTPEKRGKYLVTIAACADCHSPRDDKGQAVPGMDFAGGNAMIWPGMKDAYTANITPAVNGIPYYTEELFVETLRTGRVRERQLSPMMPTGFYRNMTDEDLKAIFAYVKTLTPVDHYVDNTMAPTACARCGLVHGGGERNKKKA